MATNGHDVMANLAARLMSKKSNAPAPVKASLPAAASSQPATAAASPPRTIPSSQVVDVQARAPPVQSLQMPAASPIVKENVRRSPAAMPTLPPQQTDTTPAEYQGPSLRGNAEQLAAIREFNQSMTKSGNKTRPGRERLLSKERSSNGSNSSRSPAASTLARNGAYPPMSSSPRVGPGTRSQTGSLPDSPSSPRPPVSLPPLAGSGGLHGRPAVRVPQQDSAPPPVKGWNSFAINPTQKAGDAKPASVAKAFQEADLTNSGPLAASPTLKTSNKEAITELNSATKNDHGSVASPVEKEEPAKPAANWQMRDITNTLNGRTSSAQPPPHLRAKTAISTDKSPAVSGTVSNPVAIEAVANKNAQPASNGMSGDLFTAAAAKHNVSVKQADRDLTTASKPELKLAVAAQTTGKAEPTSNGTNATSSTKTTVERKASTKDAEMKPSTAQKPELKPNVATQATGKAAPTTNGTNSTLSTAPAVEPKASTKEADMKPSIAKETELKPVMAAQTESKPSVDRLATEAASTPGSVNGTKATLNGHATMSTGSSTTKSEVNGDSTLFTLQEVKQMLAQVNRRVAVLEQENFSMQKQLETMLQAEERRKFLGTDNAKVPFSIDVQSRKLTTCTCLPDHSCRRSADVLRKELTKIHAGNGPITNVQVHAALKVSDLIRRMRAKADLTPAATMNPRVHINGEQAGHGMMLGEMGVAKDEKVAVVFSYDSGS
ncbi:hypothetical protein LTR37_015960 [Vermiconidia calcicola]|uniref:Uncharacterized protein n=1 Tax=Vermiconidia calcicola TaxID=1690605 RepID=A0ACC3MP86_9PEZI|nr:hypothetical protein LTR37_015960 [Vermiconidia calcicola]